jgi:predicted dehydrogenase
VFDPEPSAQEAALRDGLRVWPTVESALAESGATCALIASPPSEHPIQAIACLHAGLAVLVEKPLALSLDAAARIAQESTQAGIPVVVVQNFRFLPRERAVQKGLAEKFGPTLSAVVVSARPSSVAAPHLTAIEHGPVWDICLHHLDSLRVRFGASPTTVAMVVDDIPSESSRRTRFTIHLCWHKGPVVVYTHSEGAPGFHHTEWIEGDRSAIFVDDQDVAMVHASGRPRRIRVPRGPDPDDAVLDEFLATVDGGGPSALSVEDNLATVATVQAAIQAAQLGGPVSVSEVALPSAVGLDVSPDSHA